MTYEDIMGKLEELGSKQTKKIFLNHGAPEPLFGVKVGDLKKLVKYIRKDQNLVLRLYASGNYDAMYLAGLAADPKIMTIETLRQWADGAKWHAPAEYTVAGVAAESKYAVKLANEWIDSLDENIAVAGWATYANYISITPDELLDISEIESLLARVKDQIHGERNRVRYVMNGFVIACGTYILELSECAKSVAEAIGKVHVNVGKTSCIVPLATAYIHKAEEKNRIGVKRKTSIC